MAAVVLIIHSLVRWLVLAFGLYAIAKMVIGQTKNAPYAKGDRIAQLLFISVLDLQVLLGIVLYAVSPITRGAMKDMSAAMQDPKVRYFVGEHPVTMVIALVIAHAASVWSRKAKNDQDRFKRAGLGFALALGLIISGIPWVRMGAK